jgi:hypothetical protein
VIVGALAGLGIVVDVSVGDAVAFGASVNVTLGARAEAAGKIGGCGTPHAVTIMTAIMSVASRAQ